MAVKIIIQNGIPWWASQHIWAVPGDDPNGPKSAPIAGQNNYLWARVRNEGSTPASGVQIKYYWSNPATGVLRSNSTPVGSAFVDLDGGEEKDVLCLTPWIPIIVNNGHECVVAEAISSADPLPVPLPDEFDPRDTDQIAQRNFNVIQLSSFIKRMIFPIQISATNRKSKQVQVRLENVQLGDKNSHKILNNLNVDKSLKHVENLVEFGISDNRDCGITEDVVGVNDLKIDVKAGTTSALFVHLNKINKEQKGFQIINIVEYVDGEILGGNTLLIINK